MSFLPRLALAGAFVLVLLGAAESAQAQVNITTNSPSWGPAAPPARSTTIFPK